MSKATKRLRILFYLFLIVLALGATLYAYLRYLDQGQTQQNHWRGINSGYEATE